MTATIPAKTADSKTKLEAILSQLANCSVEITIRDLRQFTYSAEGNQVTAFATIERFLKSGIVSWSVEFDEECDMTFAYCTL